MAESAPTTYKKGEESFFKELDEYQLHMPGNTIVPFSDDQNLSDMVERQYPDWKSQGRVTSVPIARIPKVLLHNLQLHKDLQKKWKSTIRGDEAEMHLYTTFVDGSFDEESGMIVFPNFDGSHIFDTPIAKVEIDMVLVHSKKGIFVFNVKNQTGKGSSLQDVRDDIGNHNGLVRMLLNYNTSARNETIPIHSVVCDFANEMSKFLTLENENKNGAEKVLVFNKTDLKESEFCKMWNSKISAAGIKDIVWNSCLDKLVARLIALASIESSSALIQEQLRTGFAQSVANKDLLQNQFKCVNISKLAIEDTLIQQSQVESPKGKKKFILWTKEQLEVIAKVCQHLADPLQKGIRLLVTGGKGSGKTMLLIALAKLAARFIEEQTSDKSSNVLVCEGTGKSTGLRMMLEKAFVSTNVAVMDSSGDCLHRERQLKKSKVVLCDETLPNLYRYFLERLNEKQHILFFSSDKKAEVQRDFEIVHLSSGLRSTCQITHFANTYNEKGPRNVYLAFPTSKLQGEPVEVRLVHFTLNEQTTQDLFLSKCIDSIQENVEKWVGNDFLVVVPFVTSNTIQLIIESLKTKQYACYPDLQSFIRSDTAVDAKMPKMVDCDLPPIVFCQPDEIEGCEFATVVILIDTAIFETFIFPLYGSPILTAVTRASLKVVIVVKELNIPDADFMSNVLVSDQTKKVLDVIDVVRQTPDQNPSVLFVGKIPNAADFRQDVFVDNSSMPKIEGLSIYKAEHSTFLHIGDVFLEKDLEKLYNFGVRQCFISTKSVTCPWQYFYLMASTICVRNFSLRTNNNLGYKALVYNISLRKYRLQFHLAFLRQQSGISNVTFPDFWMPEFEEQSMPLTEELSWHKWRAKAEELERIGEIAPAVFVFECCIKLLSQHLQSNIDAGSLQLAENDKTELAKLSATLSKIYTERTDELVQGTKFDYQYQPLHPESCLMKALRHGLKSVEVGTSWGLSIQTMEAVIQRIKLSSRSFDFKEATSKFVLQENYGMVFERYQPNSSISSCIDLDSKMEELNSMIYSYGRRSIKESQANLTRLREDISLFAAIASNEALVQLPATFPVKEIEKEPHVFQHEPLFNQITQIVDYPLQLALLAVHWDPSNKCPQSLSLALDDLDNAVNNLKRLSKQSSA